MPEAHDALAPVLVFGWGNVARGDDGLGPLVIEAIEDWALPGVECLTDFQLQVENALDLRGRERVLFVDASASAVAPYEVCRLAPVKDDSHSTHELSPASVLYVYREVLGGEPPPTWLLGIRGIDWELGAEPSSAALANMAAALSWIQRWIHDPRSA